MYDVYENYTIGFGGFTVWFLSRGIILKDMKFIVQITYIYI